MRPILSFVALVLSLVVSSSALGHDSHGLAARHHALAELVARQDDSTTTSTKRVRKSCLNKSSSVNNLKSSTNTTTTAKPASTSTTKSSTGPSNKSVTNTGGNSGVLNKSGACGASRAQSQITALAGPNGHIDWLNCGVEGGGWNPPKISIGELKTVTLSSAINKAGSVFKPCAPYLHLFEASGAEFGIPPVILASFAMQESGCKPETVGGGGEQGLMQITQEKCRGAPGGNCREPGFNIRTAARYFSQSLNGHGGDFLRSLGAYNGWPVGMTIGYATRARWSGCCRCQNNLDYLHQFLNGWCQGVNSYGNPRLGKYFNLDVCG